MIPVYMGEAKGAKRTVQGRLGIGGSPWRQGPVISGAQLTHSQSIASEYSLKSTIIDQ